MFDTMEKININPGFLTLDGIMKKSNRSLFHRLFFFSLIIWVAGIWAFSADVQAQSGTLYGEVTDLATGESLPGATIMIKGTTIGTAADIDGRYVLRRVPVGEYVVVFSYMGYTSEELEAEIQDGERTELSVRLEDITIMGDDIVVTARQRGQARALTRQRQSINIRNIISSEQIEAFTDQDVSGALSRVVGMGHGGTNIRGVGAGASNITMDGQRMGTTSQTRSVDLSTISADMVQELDVIKVITPDMDADAMSGVINVSTRRPIGGDRTMNIRVGGGVQDRYFRHTGAGTRTSFSFGDSPSENFTYGLNFSYQRDPRASETLHTDWAGRTFDEFGRVDVVSDLRNEVSFDIRDRYGAGFQMTFQPTARSTFHVQSMFNYQVREVNVHGIRYDIVANQYTTPFQTGPLPHENQTNIRYLPRLDEPVTHQYTVQGGARHRLDRFDMEYIIGWGHGRRRENSYRFNMQTPSRYDFLVNYADRWNVEIDIAPHSEWPWFPRAENITFTQMDHRLINHNDNEFTGKVDFEVPYERGKIKFGASALLSFREGQGERFVGPLDRSLTVRDMELLPNAEWRIFGRQHSTYHIPWMVDLKKARDLYYGQRPHFDVDPDIWGFDVETSFYDAEERTLGTYLMGDVRFNRLTLLGGIRVEYFANDYTGRIGSMSDTGRFLGAVDAVSQQTNINYFPNLQLVFSVSPMTNVRAAYSRSIGRPTFNQLSPNVIIDYRNESIREGNPELDPMLSHNLDFIIDHYFMNVGQASMGLFFKDMNNFVFSTTETIRTSPGDDAIDDNGDTNPYEGWRRTTFRNGEDAYIYGIELSWQQNLTFLPGFLGNLGMYANYAYSQSFADIGRRDPRPAVDDTIRVSLIDQRPHVLNIGLSYIQGKFHSQLSYQWAAPSISSYGQLQWVPEIHQRNREYFDAYRDAANDLSLTLRYRLSDNFRLWGDASNIMNHRRIDYNFDRDYYPRSSYLSGRRINVGIQYTF